MQITFVSPTVDKAGGARVIVIYAHHLQRMGHDVRIISQPPPAITIRRKLNSWLMGRGWPRDLPLESHLVAASVNHRVLERRRPVVDADVPDGDIVIATWWQTAEWVNALSPSKGAKVYFIQAHEIFPYLPVVRSQATYRFPLHKIVVSQWLRDVMKKQYEDDVVDVVPNSVDRAQFFAAARGKQPSPTVGFLYSTAPVKGLDVAVAALRKVRERFCDLRLISFGSQPVSPTLKLPEGTEFHYSPSQDEIRNLYARCDVWVTASRSEGFNLTAIEAMACRTPVVATRTGWPEEAVVPGKNGVLVNIDDVSELARGVEWVLSLEDEDWRELSQNAHQTASVGSWEESARMFEEALRHARDRCSRNKLRLTLPSPICGGRS